jgi:hypothetical protein
MVSLPVKMPPANGKNGPPTPLALATLVHLTPSQAHVAPPAAN